MAAPERNAHGVQVIARAAAILRELKGATDGLSLGQLAGRLGLPRSTVQRIVAALQHEGFVMAAGPERGIRLGPGITSLADGARLDIAELIRPYLVDLARETGETVDLAVLRGNRLVFIDQIPGTHRLRAVSAIGESFTLHDTANGKAALALAGDEAVAGLVGADVAGAARAALFDELSRIRAEGVAFDLDEHTLGVSAVGCALAADNGEIFAVSIPVPTARFGTIRQRTQAALRSTKARLEQLAPFAASAQHRAAG